MIRCLLLHSLKIFWQSAASSCTGKKGNKAA
jgi:hypothetical protein